MVYSGVVGRTQVYLGDEELALLARVSHDTGASRSELIRRAVRKSFGVDQTLAEKRQAIAASAGSWKGRSFTGAEYVDAIRGDLNERLAKSGIE